MFRSLREARDHAISEKDRAMAAEKDTNSKYEQLLQEYVKIVLFAVLCLHWFNNCEFWAVHIHLGIVYIYATLLHWIISFTCISTICDITIICFTRFDAVLKLLSCSW